MIRLLLLLFAAHALCDYPLQGDFLARGKNHTAPLPDVPWYQCLFAHVLIHAVAVLLITGSVILAMLELIIHAGTDYAKCAGWFNSPRGDGERLSGHMGLSNAAFNVDQLIHYSCKVLWALCVVAFGRIP